MRHQRWVDAESEKRQSENAAREAIFQSELARARELVSELFTKSRRENGMIYFKQEDVKDSRAFKQAIEDFISAWTQISGERVIFVSGQGELSWFT